MLIATGSEVELALRSQAALDAKGIQVRVVSMPCWEAFDKQDEEYRSSVLPAGIPRVSIEAGITLGWQKYTAPSGAVIGIDRFGASAPGDVVADKLGMNVSNVLSTVERVLRDKG